MSNVSRAAQLSLEGPVPTGASLFGCGSGDGAMDVRGSSIGGCLVGGQLMARLDASPKMHWKPWFTVVSHTIVQGGGRSRPSNP